MKEMPTMSIILFIEYLPRDFMLIQNKIFSYVVALGSYPWKKE